MRVRDHIALSSASAALLYPWVGRKVVAAWAASILIDADHYLWFCIRERNIKPLAAYRFFNRANAPHHTATRLLHSPVAISVALLISLRRPKLLPVAAGMALHTVMDAVHELRLARSRAAALRRDNFRCQACGWPGLGVVAHIDRQPRLMPSYRSQNLIALCVACHEAAHTKDSSNVKESQPV